MKVVLDLFKEYYVIVLTSNSPNMGIFLAQKADNDLFKFELHATLLTIYRPKVAIVR